MENHVHAGGVFIITVLAIVYAANFLVRAVAAQHADNAFFQALGGFVV